METWSPSALSRFLRHLRSRDDNYSTCVFHPCSVLVNEYTIEQFDHIVNCLEWFVGPIPPPFPHFETDEKVLSLQKHLASVTCDSHQKSIPRLFGLYSRPEPHVLAAESIVKPEAAGMDNDTTLQDELFHDDGDERNEQISQCKQSSLTKCTEKLDDYSSCQPNNASEPFSDTCHSSLNDTKPPTSYKTPEKRTSNTEYFPKTLLFNPDKSAIDSTASTPLSDINSPLFDRESSSSHDVATPDSVDGADVTSVGPRKNRYASRPGDGSPNPKSKAKRGSGQSVAKPCKQTDPDPCPASPEPVEVEQEIQSYNTKLKAPKNAVAYLSRLFKEVGASAKKRGKIYVGFDEAEDSDVKGLIKIGFTSSNPIQRYRTDPCKRMGKDGSLRYAIVTYNVESFVGAQVAERGIQDELFRQRRVIRSCRHCPPRKDETRISHIEWFEMPLDEVVTVVNRWQWIIQSLALSYNDSERVRAMDVLAHMLNPTAFMNDWGRRLGWAKGPGPVTSDYVETLKSVAFTYKMGEQQLASGQELHIMTLADDLPTDDQHAKSIASLDEDTAQNLPTSKDETTSDHQVDNFDEQRRQFDMNLISLIVAFAFLVALQLSQLYSSVVFSVTWVRVG